MKRHIEKNKVEQEVRSMAAFSIIEDIKINNPKVMDGSVRESTCCVDAGIDCQKDR